LLRTPLGDLLPWLARNNPLLESVWLSVLSFEALLFTIAIAIILLAMAKERAEHRHKTAAMIDPLTGISNRRAFLEEGEQLGGSYPLQDQGLIAGKADLWLTFWQAPTAAFVFARCLQPK
jgi:hypothetical protein